MTVTFASYPDPARDLAFHLTEINPAEPWIVVPVEEPPGQHFQRYGAQSGFDVMTFAPARGDYLGAQMSLSWPGLIELSWRSWTVGALPADVAAEIVGRLRPGQPLRAYVHDLGEEGACNMEVLLIGPAVARLAQRSRRVPEARPAPSARAPGKPLDGALRAQALGMRRAGATAAQIAREVGCHVDTAHKLVAGTPRGDTEAKRQEIRRLRAAGYSVRETARLAGCTTRSVQRWTAAPGPAPSRH